MTIFKKSKSVTRFKVPKIELHDGETRTPIEIIIDMFDNYDLKDIPDGDDISYGWTDFLNPYIPNFSVESVVVGNLITANIGINRKTIPAATLKKEIFLMEQKELTEKQIPKLGRATKALIKEAATKNLLAKAPTVPVSHNMIWEYEDGIIYLLTTNSLAKNVLEDLMLEAFNIQIQMVFPFTMALDSIDEATVSALKPTVFI